LIGEAEAPRNPPALSDVAGSLRSAVWWRVGGLWELRPPVTGMVRGVTHAPLETTGDELHVIMGYAPYRSVNQINKSLKKAKKIQGHKLTKLAKRAEAVFSHSI
jgi:hypothetical protein